ncbi:TPA: hypothetical protein HA278_05940 [Candidatus Woesearchaeota archaeon]|nr:hypothetical protein [Candidatus Woesearchaeota archaeon]
MLGSLFVYASGAFNYPYLENEDPWGHSVGVKYVALEKTAYDPPLENVPKEIDFLLSYIDIYPPAYDVMMGILHQTAPDLPWVLKFFNALIISLGFVFFYLFATLLIKDRGKALFATFILAAIPSYLSHFIWAHSLVITLFFPAMYALIKIRDDKRWTIVALIIIASIWVTQNVSQPIKLSTLILLYIVIIWALTKTFPRYEFGALSGGIILSFFWWGAMIAKYSFSKFVAYYGGGATHAGETLVLSGSDGFSITQFIISFFQTITRAGGTGSRAYTFSDFFYASGQNQINNPIGIGVIISILVLIGVIYILWKYKSSIVTTKNSWRVIALFWLIFTFWGVNGQTFPISVARGPFRVWMLMAIPIALLATEGVYFVTKFFSKKKIVQVAVIFLIIMGIIMTSFIPKYELNTSLWPTSGSFTTPQEPFQYGEWFNSIPRNTKVFLYAPRDKLTIGYGAFSCQWCQNVVDARSSILDTSIQDLHTFLRDENYEFLVVNPRMDLKYFEAHFKRNDTQQILQQRYNEIMASNLLTPVHQAENSFIVLKVN